MNQYTESYRLLDQSLSIIMLMAVLIVFMACYPYYANYRKTNNYIKDEKLKHDRILKIREQKHVRQMARIKNRRRK